MTKIFTALLWCALATSAMGQIAGDPPHTIDVIEASVRDLADTMIARCDYAQGDAVPIRVADHPDASWVRSLVLRRFQERGLQTTTDADERAALNIVIEDASTRYSAMPDRDSVERTIVVKLTSTCRGRMAALPTITQRTTLTRQKVDAFQSRQHQAAHGVVPDAANSVWDDVLEPLIYVAAAAVTVVLLFTVRTQ
ncbi:MAG: hypothetical protein FGM33_04870 [Candidatus Kapabacteria bacterium]|nr:hypothetical protein [Candidatus Kapabacteria bacterium]